MRPGDRVRFKRDFEPAPMTANTVVPEGSTGEVWSARLDPGDRLTYVGVQLDFVHVRLGPQNQVGVSEADLDVLEVVE